MSTEYELFQVGDTNTWVVKANATPPPPDGVDIQMIAEFTGPGAKQRANAYALWMNGKYPTAKRNTIDVIDVNGRKFTLMLDGIEWTSDLKRGTVTARQKSSIIATDPPKPVEKTIGEQNDPSKR